MYQTMYFKHISINDLCTKSSFVSFRFLDFRYKTIHLVNMLNGLFNITYISNKPMQISDLKFTFLVKC